MKERLPLFAGLLAAGAIWLPDLLPTSQPETTASAMATVKPPVAVAADAFLARPLFDQSRRPVASGDPSAAASPAAPLAFADRFILKGLGRANGSLMSVLVDKTSGRAYRVWLGGSIDAWTLKGEQDGHLIFQAPTGEQAKLAFQRGGKPMAAQVPVTPQAVGDNQPMPPAMPAANIEASGDSQPTPMAKGESDPSMPTTP
jgi:hypothetical protein